MDKEGLDSIAVLKKTEEEASEITEQGEETKEATISTAQEKAKSIVSKAAEEAKALKEELFSKEMQRIQKDEEKQLKAFGEKVSEVKGRRLAKEQIKGIFSKTFRGYHA